MDASDSAEKPGQPDARVTTGAAEGLAGKAPRNYSLELIRLQFPLSTPNGKIETITLRRGIVRDLRMAQRAAEGVAADVDLWLVTRLAHESLTFEDVDGLDLADWSEVQARLQSFL